MTGQPAEQPDEGWTAYEVALAGLTLAAVVESGRIFDRLVPPGLLVEEVPERVRTLLAAALARSWVAYRARAASLASVHAAAWLSMARGEMVDPLLPRPPSADLDRLRSAADTVLARAADMSTGAEHAEPQVPDLATAEADLAAVQARRAAEAAEALAAAEADLARLDAEARAADEAERADLEAERVALERIRAEEQRAEREAIEALQRADAAAAAEDARREAAQDAAVRAAEERADREANAAERARMRAIEADYYRARRAAAEERRAEAAAARREARRERRTAQRGRAERVARGEVASGAAETLTEALAPVSEVVGWVRKPNADACERCIGWWKSGGDPRGASPARPYSVRMKRHNGCTCVQRPVTEEEARVRGIIDEPEPRLRNKRTAQPDPDAPAD